MTAEILHLGQSLRGCRTQRSLPRGRQLHQVLLKCGYAASLYASNCLLQMYARCSADLDDARRVFDEIPHRNCFSWNSLIDAYLKSDEPCRARQLFDSMPRKNTFSWNAMITGLVRSGDLKNARQLFEEMPVVDAVACNAILHGYIRRGQVQEAFRLLKKVDLDSILGSALVDMYAKCQAFDSAHQVLELMSEPDEFSLSALISGYGGCGRLDDAIMIFNQKEKPSVVLWNSIINAYASSNQGDGTLELFKMMTGEGIMPNSSTFSSVLSACASIGIREHGVQMHACGCKHGILEDLVVASALIDCYSKCGIWEDACKVFRELRLYDTILLNTMINVYSNCGQIEEARKIFEMIPSKNMISWNSMIVGYSQNGHAVQALELFIDMHHLDLSIDKVALASAISSCASICALTTGEELFALATRIGLVTDLVVTSSLVDLYCKCGKVIDGRRLFDGMPNFDVALWNSMLMGYASNGYAIEVLELFESMGSAGVSPNEVTFIAVLSACCHSGLVEKGLMWFRRMKVDYCIEPTAEHYSCVVDLLVRAGRLEESINFIDTMPFKPDASMWTSVLGGCKAHGDEVLGSKVAERLIELNPQHSGPFLQLSSIYAAHGEWENSAQVRQMMNDRRINKNPGYSWIDGSQ
uniref:Pentatricopeptide repeat-containing protein n=1 Tax=Musa acuminata subsp. malaccensis TaxID=214687 RepID=A0A804IF83_MUSAM